MIPWLQEPAALCLTQHAEWLANAHMCMEASPARVYLRNNACGCETLWQGCNRRTRPRESQLFTADGCSGLVDRAVVRGAVPASRAVVVQWGLRESLSFSLQYRIFFLSAVSLSDEVSFIVGCNRRKSQLMLTWTPKQLHIMYDLVQADLLIYGIEIYVHIGCLERGVQNDFPLSHPDA